jgi:hypothetical protein
MYLGKIEEGRSEQIEACSGLEATLASLASEDLSLIYSNRGSSDVHSHCHEVQCPNRQ